MFSERLAVLEKKGWRLVSVRAPGSHTNWFYTIGRKKGQEIKSPIITPDCTKKRIDHIVDRLLSRCESI